MEIKKKKLILLRNIISCSDIQVEAIRNMRNSEEIKKFMYTNHIISKKEHLNYIENLKEEKNKLVFCVLKENKTPIGVVSINSIDYKKKKSDWAFYLNSSERNGLGGFIEFNIINFIFDRLNLEKLNCEVIETNQSVLKLHGKFFFKQENFKEEQIIKNNKKLGIHFLGLNKDNWLLNRLLVSNKYKILFNRFEFKIEY